MVRREGHAVFRDIVRGVVLCCCLLLTACSPTLVDEPGSIDVHFCPAEDCGSIFTQQLAQARISLDCALYDIDGDIAWKAIDAAQRRIPGKVRIVMDSDYRKEAANRTFIRFDTNSGLMHNKFCIIDGKIVTGGSMNPTVNDMTKNFNNFALINASGIAANYEAEFDELWSGTFRSGEANSRDLFMINGTLVEQYFCPDDDCEDHVIQAIADANTSVRFMTFSFTSMPIAAALIDAKVRGVSVEGLYEKRQVNAYSIFDELAAQGITSIIAKNPSGGQLHHKVFIIDNQTVILGSYNPTKNGDTGNDENIVMIHDSQIAHQFTKEYERIKATSG